MEPTEPKAITTEVVRRANETIAIAPKSGRITLVTRRIFNTMLFFSQKDGPQDIYRRSLGELARTANFTSEDTSSLKEHIRSMMDSKVEWNIAANGETRWGISTMIANVEIIEQKGIGTFVEWEISRKIRDRLLDHRFYTKLSMQIHSSLRSGASIALYEICSRYTTNHGGLTMREHWEWWRPRITGNPEPDAHPEYKYFKRDVLKLAISEVNAMADIKIELLEFRVGRRIEEIQFKVQSKELPKAHADNGQSFDGELLEQIIRLGVTQKEARTMYSAHAPDFLRKTLILTDKRARDPKAEPLKSKAAWFKQAIKGRYADAQEATVSTARKASTDTPEARRERAMARFNAHRHAQALGHYMELDPKQQAEARAAFMKSTPVTHYREEIRKRALTSPAVKAAFSAWHAEQLWGAPTEAEILEFMMSNAEIKAEE
jgi:plasmid replication initiation protein